MLERIAEILETNGIEFTPPLKKSTELVADLNLNSFYIFELASVLEDEFGVEIPDRSIKDMKTIGDVIDLIESLQ